MFPCLSLAECEETWKCKEAECLRHNFRLNIDNERDMQFEINILVMPQIVWW